MEITNNSIQNVGVGANVLFTETPVKPSRCMSHREGSGLVTLRGMTSGCQSSARFFVDFSANIAVPTGQTPGAITLAIAISGEAVQTSSMTVTPGAVEGYFNVSAPIYISVPSGCCMTISVKNTSTIPVNVRNANLIVARVA